LLTSNIVADSEGIADGGVIADVGGYLPTLGFLLTPGIVIDARSFCGRQILSNQIQNSTRIGV